MATEELKLTEDAEEEPEVVDAEVDEDFVDVLVADVAVDEDEDGDGDGDEDSKADVAVVDGADDETVEALEELESEELALLDEEVNEALLVDEVKELKAIRREELTMDVDAQAQRSDEFVCQSCFMVKRTSQLANRKKMLCTDCAY